MAIPIHPQIYCLDLTFPLSCCFQCQHSFEMGSLSTDGKTDPCLFDPLHGFFKLAPDPSLATAPAPFVSRSVHSLSVAALLCYIISVLRLRYSIPLPSFLSENCNQKKLLFPFHFSPPVHGRPLFSFLVWTPAPRQSTLQKDLQPLTHSKSVSLFAISSLNHPPLVGWCSEKKKQFAKSTF